MRKLLLLSLFFALPLLAADLHPNACVDCHGSKAPKMSVILAKWAVAVDPKVVARMQPLAPSGITLKGRHPNTLTAAREIPGACVQCHLATSRLAPPLAPMLHILHWPAVDCTSCHKPNLATSVARVPSRPEK